MQHAIGEDQESDHVSQYAISIYGGELPHMADEVDYKKVTRKADKGLEGKVIAKHGKQTNQKP